eukprot:COSAG04_NODE_27982_length_278_cov_1.139665_1_plen_22_part_01
MWLGQVLRTGQSLGILEKVLRT